MTSDTHVDNRVLAVFLEGVVKEALDLHGGGRVLFLFLDYGFVDWRCQGPDSEDWSSPEPFFPAVNATGLEDGRRVENDTIAETKEAWETGLRVWCDHHGQL